MNAEELKAMEAAWRDIPSQDNEGYVPDRGGFKSGWSEALKWERARVTDLADDLKRALRIAQHDICDANCIKGPPRPHCPACVDAQAALQRAGA